jgi:hypothetical protein
MMKRLLAMVLALGIAAPLAATPLDGQETYDLLFRNGTLDQIDRNAALHYARQVTNGLKPEAADRDTGEIALSFPADKDGVAHLEFRRDGKHRALGVFPASVGNPMIMYFYESVVRDMAEAAGGSPFYIRNRVKESLVQTSDIEAGQAVVDGRTVPTQTIRLYPFAGDPNADRMQGFGDLELTVTMSDEVPGWYVSFLAEAPQPTGDEPVYRSEVRFVGLEPVQ